MAIAVRSAAVGLTWAIAVAQTDVTPARPTVAQALQRANELLGSSLPKARAAFEAIVADREWYWHQPLAVTALATVARLEGQPWDGLARLRDARELLRQQAPAGQPHPLHGPVMRQILIESIYCHVGLGLVDLARNDAEALQQSLSGADASERFGAALAEIDRLFGSSAWALARHRANAALADPELLQANPRAHEELATRVVLAGRRLARTPIEAAAAAHELEQRLVATRAVQLQFRLTMEAAAAWLAAGKDQPGFSRMRERLAGLPVAGRAAERAELLAMRARFATAAGKTEELPALREQLAAAIADNHAEVRSIPPRPGGVGFFHFETARNPLAVLVSLDRRLQPDSPEVAFAHLESGFALGTLSRRLRADGAAVAAIRSRLLPAGSGLLAYLLAPAGGHVLALDADGGVHEEFTVQEPFLAEIRELTRDIEHEPSDRGGDQVARVRERAARLAVRLLPETIVRRVRRWRRVLLVGDEQGVGRIWQALPWETEWTCTALAVTHVGSATLGLALAERAAGRAARDRSRFEVAVVGDPVHADGTERYGVAPLRLSTTQRDLLVRGLPEPGEPWWRERAQPAVLRDPRVANAEALCIVAHGIQEPRRERFAGLLLAPGTGRDGTLFADEIETLVVPRLVVLAACSPGLGPQRVGEDGGSHPGGAFLTAGAETVVLASGQVPLEATLEIVGDTLAAVHSGAAVAAALQAARRRVAAQDQRRHPYYFAGLRAIGLGGPLAR